MSLPSRQAKPSDKLNPKTIDPFKDVKSKSDFAAAYSNGRIPCRLAHGSVKHKLSWTMPITSVVFDPVLVLLAEGIRETVHPYQFVARVGFQELLEVPEASSRVADLIPRIIPALRAALGHKDDEVFLAGLEATLQLSRVIGPALDVHLKTLLPSIARHMMNKKHRDQVLSALHEMNGNGGKLSEIEECVIGALHYGKNTDEQLMLKGICEFSQKDCEGFDAFVKVAVESMLDNNMDDYEESIGSQKLNLGDELSSKVVVIKDSLDDFDFNVVRSTSGIELCDSDCDTCCVAIESPLGLSPDIISPDLVELGMNNDVNIIASLPQLQSSSQLACTSPDINNNRQIPSSYPMPIVESRDVESDAISAVDRSRSVSLSASSQGIKSDEGTVDGVAGGNSVTFTASAVVASKNSDYSAVVTASTPMCAPCKPMACIKKLEEGGAAVDALPTQSASKPPAKILPKSYDPSTFKAQKPSSQINQAVRQHPYKKPYDSHGRTDRAFSSRRETCVDNIFKIYREHQDLDDLLRCQTTKLFCKRQLMPFIDTNLLQINYLCDEPAFKGYNFVRTTESEARRLLGRLEEIQDDIEDIPFTADDIQHFTEKSKLAEELDRAMAELPESSSMTWF